jgi:hypothetical protein
MTNKLFLLIFLSGVFIQNRAFCQGNKTCDALKGRWYYTLMDGAREPVYLVFTGCEWKEEGNPMGNRKGSSVYSTEKKKYQILGLSDADSGPVYLENKKDYSYLRWISSWTNEPSYIILTRQKYSGKWYDQVKEKLQAEYEAAGK